MTSCITLHIGLPGICLKAHVCTLQEENLNWNLNFAILLMANLLNLNSAYNYIFSNFSMIAYNKIVIQ